MSSSLRRAVRHAWRMRSLTGRRMHAVSSRPRPLRVLSAGRAAGRVGEMHGAGPAQEAVPTQEALLSRPTQNICSCVIG